MGKRVKKVISVVLTCFMALSTTAVNVRAEETKKYTIYPTPQNISYSGDEMTLSSDINIVYDQGIDSYTKDHVNDVLEILGKNGFEGQAIVNGKTNVLVGIYNSNDYVNQYFNDQNLISDESLFSKNDAYILSIKDDVIAVLGKDTDAAFHGITSLKHIFNQVEDNRVLSLTMNDYADVKGRGFIEGYYGNPWSNEDRADLMMFGGDYKLNQYIYAPKDDPKHNAKWRELYTDDELAKIAELAEAGNRSKCYYVYALHPFMSNVIRFDTDEHYEEDLNVIKAKFEQVMGAGVKQFAILADDAAVPSQGASCYVRLMSDITDWLKEKQATVSGLKSDTIFCPNDYMGSGSSAQMQTLKQLPSSVSIIQTGGRVWGEVGPSFNNSFYNNMGRPAYMWINWPCSDNTKDGLIMGGAEAVLKPNVNPDTIEGIVLNPMQQSEPSKEALFTNADYAWNIWENASDYNQVWYDSFNYMDHGTIADTDASIALRELSKHMMNSQQIGNEESVDLKDKLSQFQSDLSSGRSIKELGNELIQEFEKLQNAAKTYREQAGNTRTRDQIVYWLDCWDDTTTSVLSYLHAAIALEDNEESSVIWDYFAEGQAAYEQSTTHKFYYVDHDEAAKVGRRYLTPFMAKLDEILSTKVATIVDPSKQVISFITNRTDTPEGNTSLVLDDKETTEIVFKTPNSISEGTYVGLSYTKAIDINKVIFRLGRSGNLNDTFTAAKVQYTTDGNVWEDVNDEIYTTPQEVVLNDLGLKGVKGIRMIATSSKSNTWLGVRDITVNPEEVETPDENRTTVSVDKLSVQGGSLNNIVDDSSSTYVHLAEDPYKGYDVKDYIPVDASVILTFDRAKKLNIISFKQDSGTDKLTKYAIEYTIDGETWTTLQEYSGDAEVELNVSSQNLTVKAIRVRNLALNVQSNGESGYWWKLYEFNVKDQTSIEPTLMYTDRWTIYSGNAGNLTDGDESTALDFNSQSSAQVDDYIGWDFGQVIEVGQVSAILGGNRAAGDKFAKYALEYSKDGNNWTTYKTYTGATDAKDYVNENLLGEQARYVRIRNLEARNVWVIFSEFSVKQYNPDENWNTLNVYSNVDFNLKSSYTNASTALMSNDNITLQKDEYIGVDLSRIKDLKSILTKTTQDDALTLQVSKNQVDWINIQADELPDARYVRLINLNEDAVEFKLNTFVVESDEITAPSLYETTMGINASWGVSEDTRNNGAAFDGDVNTTTEFGDLPQKDQYIIYDLGQERTISKLTMFCQDSALNYIRDADILISDDLQTWTKVVTIGDGVENENDANVTCLNSDAGYTASSTYPNKVYVEGTIAPEQARYIKILMTATNNNRAVVFNEIMINDGEYAPVSNDPTFASNTVEVQGFVPQNMFDGDLSTAYKPNTTEAGYIQYTFSDNLEVNRLNIVQKGTASHAKVWLLAEKDGQREWVEAGQLDKSLNEIYSSYDRIFELKIEWEANQIPTITEIVSFNDEDLTSTRDELNQYISELNVDEDQYTASSFNNFTVQLNDSKDVLDNAFSSTKVLQKALDDLKIAYGSLVTKGDKQLIQNELDAIALLNKEDYTDDSWDTLQTVVNDANELLESNDFTEANVTVMVDNLQKAKAQLVTVASIHKDTLSHYIETNQLEDLDTSLYLTKTVKPFEEALKQAKDVLEDENASVLEIDDAYQQLQNARGGLILKAHKDELANLKALADSYHEEDYTQATWIEFEKVLSKVNEAITANESTSEDVTKLRSELEDAAKLLVQRTDTSEIRTMLEAAKKLDEKKYTEDSYKVLSDAIRDIEKELENTDLTDEEVQALEMRLQSAVEQLEEIQPTPTEPTDPVEPDNPTPTEPTDPVEPDNPTPTEPTDPAQPNQPTPGIDVEPSPTPTKPNDQSQKDDSVQTGDVTPFIGMCGMVLLGIAGMWIFRKKEKN